MSRILRAALTETINAYPEMPERAEDLYLLADRLEDVRRANLDHNAALVREASRRGAKLVCLSELFAGPYFALDKNPLWLPLAEDAREGPSIRRMRAVAADSKTVIIAPIYEVDARTGRRFDTAVVIDEAGRVLGGYRKTHIPCGTNEQASFHETFYYQASDGGDVPADEGTDANVSDNPYFPVFETSLGKIGIAICYDRHFEGVVRSLALGGAEAVLCPAVSFGKKSEEMWEHEFPTDALRHKLYIGASNRRGAERPWNVLFYGHSYFVGPEGRLQNSSDHPELVIADLELDRLIGSDTSGWNLPRDLRPDIYSKR